MVEPISAYLRELFAAGRSVTTIRSYAMDLLRWFASCERSGCCFEERVRAHRRPPVWGCRSVKAANKLRPGQVNLGREGVERPRLSQPASHDADCGEDVAADAGRCWLPGVEVLAGQSGRGVG